jgi:hypothetical protein
MEYRTTQDIVIPAGTKLMPPPLKSTRWGNDYEGVVGHGADHTSYWSINVQEGLEVGIIEPLER